MSYAQRRTGKDHHSQINKGEVSSYKTPKVLNNYDWFSQMTALDFLGSVGRYARVNSMLAKESVRSRIESTQGISFTEFSYQLLQAYDFWYLYNHHDCRIQVKIMHIYI